MRYVLALAAALSVSGCYRIHYITGAPQESGVPTREQWHHDFIDGLWEASDPVDVTGICPNGFARVDNEVTVLNWLAGVGVQLVADVPLAILTSTSDNPSGYSVPFQIWDPSTVSVFCAMPGQMVPNAPQPQYPGAPPPQYYPQQAPPPGQYPQQQYPQQQQQYPQQQYPQQQYPQQGQGQPPSYPPPPPSYPPPPPPPPSH